MIAVLHLLGGHWFALQGVAWVTMLVDRTQDSSLAEALDTTFDGQHPCSLCKAVAAGKKEERERQNTLADPGAKLVAVLVAVSPLPPLSSSEIRYFPYQATVSSLEFPLPPTPPWAA